MKEDLIQEALRLEQQTGKKKPNLPGYEIIEVFNVDEVEGFIAKKKDWLYIAFHHTDSFKDALNDIRAKKIRCFENGVRIHRGFLMCYEKVANKIYNGLLRNDVDNILITGHSMGAAIATICAYDLSETYCKLNAYCITTGSPRVGNYKFRREFNKAFKGNAIRLVNGNDIVAQLPPWWLLYFHCGKLERIGKHKWWRFWGSTKDHDKQRYVENKR